MNGGGKNTKRRFKKYKEESIKREDQNKHFSSCHLRPTQCHRLRNRKSKIKRGERQWSRFYYRTTHQRRSCFSTFKKKKTRKFCRWNEKMKFLFRLFERTAAAVPFLPSYYPHTHTPKWQLAVDEGGKHTNRATGQTNSCLFDIKLLPILLAIQPLSRQI